MGHAPVDWHPWRNNPLDCVHTGRCLNLADGTPVWLTKPFHFRIEIGERGDIAATIFDIETNSACCAKLNELGVGIAFYPVS